MNTQDLQILHPCTPLHNLDQLNIRDIVDTAEGIYIKEKSGNRLIDGIAGLWCANIGHGRKEIADVLHSAVTKLDYFHTFNGISNVEQNELSKKLIDITPASLDHVFFGCSGSDANDTLVKIAWQYHIAQGKPQKRKFISRWQAYHGTSISTASLTGLPAFHKAFHLPLDFVVHTDTPHFYKNAQQGESEQEYTNRLLSNLRILIEDQDPNTIAAFIGEPIMGAGGVITPPEGYWEGVQKICHEYDILLVLDEVVCGYGRTGKTFGCDHYNIQPDMMATAKGLTSGIFPMSAAFISNNIYNALASESKVNGSFYHGYTYSGHPIGSAVALKVLEIIEQESLVENSRIIGNYLHEQLHKQLYNHPQIAEIRGKGLLASIQLVKDKNSREYYDPTEKIPAKLANACKQAGLIIRPLPSIGAMALSPPMIVNKNDIDQIVKIVANTINDHL